MPTENQTDGVRVLALALHPGNLVGNWLNFFRGNELVAWLTAGVRMS